MQHLALLLASPHKDVVVGALQALVAFLKKTYHSSIRWQGFRDLNTRLLAMAQGWGGKEEVRRGRRGRRRPLALAGLGLRMESTWQAGR